MSFISNCEICGKSVDLSQNPVPNADEIVVFNCLKPYNHVAMLCSDKCKEKYIPGFCGCVACSKICENDKWYLHVKFVKLGGWTSIRATCSENCQKKIIKEETDDIEFRYQCRNCQKCSEKKLKKCSACRKALYCNETCQKEHWSIHKNSCKYL